MPPHDPPHSSNHGPLHGESPVPVAPPENRDQKFTVATTPEMRAMPAPGSSFVVEIAVPRPLIKEPDINVQTESGKTLQPLRLRSDDRNLHFWAEFEQVVPELGGLIVFAGFDENANPVSGVQPFNSFSLTHGGEYSLCGPHNDVCFDFSLNDRKQPFKFCLNQPLAKQSRRGGVVAIAFEPDCKDVPAMRINIPTDLADDPDAEIFSIALLDHPDEGHELASNSRTNALVGLCDADVLGSGTYGVFAVAKPKTIEQLEKELTSLRALLVQRELELDAVFAYLDHPGSVRPRRLQKSDKKRKPRHDAW